jgi:transcriptional regulator with XRE-family HTH domain
MRKASGLTGERLARLLGWPKSKVPKLENGRQMPAEADIRAWAQACGQPEAIPELLGMLSEAQTVHRQWKLRLRGGLTSLQEEIGTLEQSGKRIRNFEIAFIPGLLQTEEYARYRILEAERRYGIADVDAAVAARMRRQAVLYRHDKTFEFVITEAALRFLLCPGEVMLGQLDRLLVDTMRSGITLGVIPFGVELPVAPVAGFLKIDDVTFVEVPAGEDAIPARGSADYDEDFDLLLAESVTGEQARRLITAAAAALREDRR